MTSSSHSLEQDISGAAEPGLKDIIVTELLRQRPMRPPDHAAESRAFIGLSQAMSEAPLTFLQKLVDAAIELTRADSVGDIRLSDTVSELLRFHSC